MNDHRNDQPWWYQLASATIRNPVFEHQAAIYTNRSLRMDRIAAIGFDFDHTLALYNCARLDGLAMKLVSERLIEQEGMPDDFMNELPEASFACKGLVVDIQEGNVCKIDRHGYVVQAYHGPTPLNHDARRKLYGAEDFIPNVTHGRRFIQVDSDFAKPEVLIFAALAPRVGKARCKDLWRTIRYHTDMIHRDGSLKRILMADPLHYLSPDVEIVPMLQTLKSWGKKVFLLTNSEWHYTKAMINFALGTADDPEDLGWLELFDLVVCQAGKPGYFSAKKSEPGAVCEPGVDKLTCGGNIEDLEERLGCGGNEVLYVGDHIYADLITSKRSNHWRTMLVIAELAQELEIHIGLPGMAMQMKQADDRRRATEQEVHYWRVVEKALDRIADPEHTALSESLKDDCAKRRKQAQDVLKQYIRQRESLRHEMSVALNRYWGSLFRAGPELTHYGRQLEDFACAYTSKASNLAHYPQDYYFRSSMDFLPHELESL
ncbi:MAG: HAD-IG family 5'-nucleotidase [Planctomycetes bacterium]|nr:HAD-IG family 5'-nucleotidase [Planctomycetota bacterium]